MEGDADRLTKQAMRQTPKIEGIFSWKGTDE